MNKLKDFTMRALAWIWSKVGHVFNDETYLKVRFFLLMDKKLNLKNPQTFSEKLQWLKLYNRRPQYTKMVDKYAVKDYVAGLIGDEYVIPTLGVWNRPEDIDWDSLPNRFVLKTTHGGGSNGVVICNDKSTFNKAMAIKRLKKDMKESDWRIGMEWPYKDVEHRILAEQYICPMPNKTDLADYKWYCFNGEPKFCQVIQDRTTKETIDFFDTEWRHQEFIGLNAKASNAKVQPKRPKDLSIQIHIAKELSKGIPFSRIDLYSVGGKTLFGEITFFPMSGFGDFYPEKYNKILGDLITLPSERWGDVSNLIEQYNK